MLEKAIKWFDRVLSKAEVIPPSCKSESHCQFSSVCRNSQCPAVISDKKEHLLPDPNINHDNT